MKKKILIVDDAPFMRKVASDILSTKYTIVSAASGPDPLLYTLSNIYYL